VVFDLDTISVQEIREQADYPGLRVRVAVLIGPWKGAAAWDVSTGDPIVPPPRYAVAVDAAAGIGTGISATDRAETARQLADPNASAASFTRPRHVALRARTGR
jgi:hypothetical protein